MARPAFQEHHVPENFQDSLIPPALLPKEVSISEKGRTADTFLTTPNKQQDRKGISPGLKRPTFPELAAHTSCPAPPPTTPCY